MSILHNALYLFEVDLTVETIVFNLSEQLATHIKVLHQIFVFQHSRHNMCHRKQGISLAVVRFQHSFVVEDLQQEVHIIVFPHHHFFIGQIVVVAIARRGRVGRVGSIGFVHLTISIVNEEVFSHRLHIYWCAGKIDGFCTKGTHIFCIGDAHLNVVTWYAFHIVGHFHQHHVAFFRDSAEKLTCIAIEVAIGVFVFFHKIEHPIVHLRHNERLRIENKKFVFRLWVCPSSNNNFKK